MAADRPELMEEIRLNRTPKEREINENMAELYSMLIALQKIEKAYLRDDIKASDYTPACSKLLDSIKTQLRIVRDSQPETDSVEQFAKKFKVDCSAALERIREDRPATFREVSKAETAQTNATIAEIVSLFITLMDKLRLQLHATDQLSHDVRDLNDALCKLLILPPDFEAKRLVAKWLIVLRNMQASDELSADQVRQALYDLETAYNAFNKFLKE